MSINYNNNVLNTMDSFLSGNLSGLLSLVARTTFGSGVISIPSTDFTLGIRHNFGAVPQKNQWDVAIVYTGASPFQGYHSGEEVTMSSFYDNNNTQPAFTASVDSSGFYFTRNGSNTKIESKIGNGYQTITVSNWGFKIYAYN